MGKGAQAVLGAGLSLKGRAVSEDERGNLPCGGQGLAPFLPLTLMETRRLNPSTKNQPFYPHHQRPNACSQAHSSPDLHTVQKETLKSKRFMVINAHLNIILVTITSNSTQP